MEILLKDGVKYDLWIPQHEVQEFEPMIKHHVKDIFGDACKYFAKRELKTRADSRSIPDGFVIDFKNQEWYIVELKLLCDDAIRRIRDQMSEYTTALKRTDTKKVIYESFRDQIKEPPSFLYDLVFNKEPKKVIIIDRLDDKQGRQFKEKVEEPYKIADSIIVFKTFARENVDKKEVHIHLFEPLHNMVPQSTELLMISEKTIKVTARKGKFQGLFDPKTQEIIIDDERYSPSGVAKKLTGYSIDGWHFWKFRSPNGKLLPIDNYRKGSPRTATIRETPVKSELQKVTAGEFQYKGNGIFALRREPTVQIDAKKATKEVTTALENHGYSITRPSSFYHQLRKKAGLLGQRK